MAMGRELCSQRSNDAFPLENGLVSLILFEKKSTFA
jgi:hypothetical protein